MWKLQGGSYIPGVSSQAFGSRLGRDVKATREDQSRKAEELNKYMSKRQMIQKWGGRGLKALGVPDVVGDIGGYGLSKLFGGDAPDVEANKSGLLGSGYEQLGEAAGGIEKSMLGRLGGSMFSSLGGAGGVGKKLGEAFKQTRAGVRMGELKSGYGKMMAGKGINIGQALPEAEQIMDLEGTGLGSGFDYGDAPSNQLTEDLGWFDKASQSYLAKGQQGGYMQGYQEGGEANNGILSKLNQLSDMQKFYEGEGPKTESGDLKFGPKGMITREGLAEQYNFPLEEAVFDTSYGEPGSGNMAIDISIPSNDRLLKYQRSGNMPGKKAEFMSKSTEAEQSMRKAFPDEYQSLATDIGFGDYSGAAEKVGSGWLDMSPLERMRSRTSSLGSKKNIPSESDEKKQMMMKALGMEESEYDSFMKWKKSKGMQQGGMMPGGVSNALPYQQGGSISPYNLGGSVTQQPMAYQLGGLLKYKRSPMMG